MFSLLALLACNGQDTGLTALHPVMTLAPEALEFGEQGIHAPAQRPVYVGNGGQVSLDGTVEVVGDAVFTVADGVVSVPAGEVVELPVVFTPVTFLDYEARLVFSTNDPEQPQAELAVTGEGVPAPVPDIAVRPMSLDFGEVGVNTDTVEYLIVANEGTAPLTLDAVSQSGAGAFTLVTDPSFATVAPGTELPVLVRYRPTQDAGDSGALTIRSDDPDEPEVEVLLLGNGGGDFEYPIARIADCPRLVHPPEIVPFDGRASTAPGGGDLDYAWTLSGRPPGSQAALTSNVGDATSFFADSAGPYEVQLVVTDDRGVASAPARCTVDAVPQDEVHVELTWDTAHADLDLHLSQPGAALFQNPGDCNFCNPNPSWGASGPNDDPRLDIDDTGGFGPENINIALAQNGAYHVRVHYYDRRGDDAVRATVRVYLYGALVAELRKTMTRNQVWDVGQINMPDGTFGPETTPLYDATDRTCF